MAAALPGPSDVTPPSIGERLRRGAGWVIIGRGLGIFSTALVNVIALPRLLEKEDVGAFLGLTSGLVLATHLTMFGLNQGLVRVLSESLALGHPDRARATLRSAVRIALTAALLMAPIGGAVMWFVGFPLLKLTPSIPLTVLLVVCMILLAWQQIAAESLRGLHEIRFASLLSGGLLGGPVTNFLFLGWMALFTLGPGLDLVGAFLAFAAALAVTCPLAVGCLAWNARQQVLSVSVPTRLSEPFWTLCLPLLLVALLDSFFVQGDYLFASIFGSEAQAALYGQAKRLVVFLSMPLQMVNLTIISSVPELHVQGRRDELQRLFRFAAMLALPALVVAAVMLIAPRLILTLVYPAGYEEGAQVLQILALGQIALLLAGSCGITLAMTGHHRTALIINIFGALGLLLAGPFAARHYGMPGLAVVASASQALVVALQWAFTRHYLGVWTHFSLSGTYKLGREQLAKRRVKENEFAAQSAATSDLGADSRVRLSNGETSAAAIPPQVHAIWWLHPGWLFATVCGTTMLAALMLSPQAFEMYDTYKFVTWEDGGLAALMIAAFGAGTYWAGAVGRRPTALSKGEQQKLYNWFWIAGLLTLLGYGAWYANSVLHGLNIEKLRVLWDLQDKWDATDIRDEIFPTVPGLTTCTQFGMLTILLGLIIKGHKRWVLTVCCSIFALAAVRMLFISERLAVIEIVVPSLVLWLRRGILARPKLSKVAIRRLQLLPLAGVVGIIVLFGGAEYFRSWRFYEDKFDSFADFTLWRLSGYYTTAHNNGAMSMAKRGPWPLPYYTLEQFWRFPLIQGSDFSYQSLTGIDPDQVHTKTLQRFATEELNNQGGLFSPAMDFGWTGAIIYWLFAGIVAGRLYQGFLAGSLGGLIVYPLVVLSIAETPRILYACCVRSFPPLVMMALILFSTKFHRFYQAAPQPLPPSEPVPC